MKIEISQKGSGAVMTIVPTKEVKIEVTPEDLEKDRFTIKEMVSKAIKEGLK